MVEILWGRSSGLALAGLNLLTLDACLSQDHEYKNKVTSYPVENGLDVSDHVRQEPDELKIEGVISDTPDGVDSVDGSYSDSAYKALCAVAGRDYVSTETAVIKNEYPAPIIVDVIVKYRVFTDMILETLSVPRTTTTGDSINFTAHFKKFRKADVSLATINYARGGSGHLSQGNVDQGKQQTGAVDDPTKNALQNASDRYGAWWNGDISLAQLVGG